MEWRACVVYTGLPFIYKKSEEQLLNKKSNVEEMTPMKRRFIKWH